MCRFQSRFVRWSVATVCGLLLNGSVLAAERPNVLFIAIDDLRNDLGVLGVEHARTPSLDAFAATARAFSHHYVHVPTCGASRCALLRGRYPTQPAHVNNNAIRQTQQEWIHHSLPGWLKAHGYQTLSLGKISHYPGNLTGKDWNAGPEEMPEVWERAWIPRSPWPHAQAMMHGYAQGSARKPGVSHPIEAVAASDDAYPDAWVASEAISTLEELQQSTEPWFFAVGFFKPHLPFAAPRHWWDQHDPQGIPVPPVTARPAGISGWHGSGEFRGNYGHDYAVDGDAAVHRDPSSDSDYARLIRHGYAAAISYMDAQAGRLLQRLDQLDPDRRTVVVVWSDHGFLLGEHAIWGKHCLYEHAIRSPLIIRSPDLNSPGQISHTVVQTVDIFPTLNELCGLPSPAGLDGRSLRPFLSDARHHWSRPAISFWTNNQKTIRTDRWRLIAHAGKAGGKPDGWELFDMQADPFESVNVADTHPEVVQELLRLIP